VDSRRCSTRSVKGCVVCECNPKCVGLPLVDVLDEGRAGSRSRIVKGYIEFRFGRYGSAELFRAACKRRGVLAKQDLEKVYVPEIDAEHVRQLAHRYGLRTVDGMPQ
jgi:hypothetical protein